MKWSILLIFVILSIHTQAQDTWEEKADSIVEIANEQLGIAYKWATSIPGVSFDCSGFTSYVYSSTNVQSSRSSKAYGSLGEPISIENCRKGDCIVFSGTQEGSTTIGHVGIIIENNENGIKFIHCSSSKKHFGVVVTSYFDSGYPKRFLEIRRLY